MSQSPIPFQVMRELCAEQALTALATLAATGPLDQQYMQQLLADGVGDMDYLRRQSELRSDPKHLMPDYVNMLVCALPYQPQREDQDLKRARYAAGKDYHKIFRKKLSTIAKQLPQADGVNYQSRAVVDSAPLNERSLAARAGLGWLGKNALLIHPQFGSYHFLGFLLTNAPLEIQQGSDNSDRCGICTRCHVQCPTQALVGRRVLSERCISYLTIEHKGIIKAELAKNFNGWWYGCDVCQEVCPWNRFSHPQLDQRLCGHDAEAEILHLREAQFDAFTLGRALKRISYAQFRRNVLVALWSLGRAQECQSFDHEDIALVQAQAQELGLT